MSSLAYERAAHIMEMARLDQEQIEAAGTPTAPTERELRLEAIREENRRLARDHWINIYLPFLQGTYNVTHGIRKAEQ